MKINNGQYYSAVYNGKKIRGVISKKIYGWAWVTEFTFANSQGEGKETQYDEDFTHKLEFELERDKKSFIEKFNKKGLTDLKILTDPRQKKLINLDKRPKVFSHSVTPFKKRDGTEMIRFGCGEVELERAVVKNFLEVFKTIKNGNKKIIDFLTVLEKIEKEDESLLKLKVKDVEDVLSYNPSL